MKSIRVWYNKTGRMKYISHLDMTRVFSRIIRRAKLPVWFTEGFNPRPYINFALPLSLGFESLSEAVDMRITDDEMSLDDVRQRLSEAMPEGLTVTDVCEQQRKFSEIAFAEFEVILRSQSKTAADVDEFLSQQSILCDKRTKKGTMKQIDLKEKIKFYNVSDGENGLIALTLTLAAGSNDNLNPTLVILALNSAQNDSFSVAKVVRKQLFDDKMQIFR